MKKTIFLSLCTVVLALSLGACKKTSDTPPPTNSANTKNPADLIHTMAKDKVSVEEKKGVYIAFGDMNVVGCVKHKTAVCYWITVTTSNPTHKIVMDGDIEGNYTATPEYPEEDQITMHVNTPEGVTLINTTQITQTVDENGTATVSYK